MTRFLPDTSCSLSTFSNSVYLRVTHTIPYKAPTGRSHSVTQSLILTYLGDQIWPDHIFIYTRHGYEIRTWYRIQEVIQYSSTPVPCTRAEDTYVEGHTKFLPCININVFHKTYIGTLYNLKESLVLRGYNPKYNAKRGLRSTSGMPSKIKDLVYLYLHSNHDLMPIDIRPRPSLRSKSFYPLRSAANSVYLRILICPRPAC